MIFVVFSVYWAIEAASFGARLVNLEQKVFGLEKENRQLSDKLIGATSLAELSAKTEGLGFTKPANIVYIGKDDYVAKLLP